MYASGIDFALGRVDMALRRRKNRRTVTKESAYAAPSAAGHQKVERLVEIGISGVFVSKTAPGDRRVQQEKLEEIRSRVAENERDLAQS